MQECFTLAEARALQGTYLIATRYLMERDPVSGEEVCVVPENHTVQVIGMDAGYEGDGVASAGIAVQYYGHMIGDNRVLPKVILMNKTTFEQHFIVA
jgi:hypothetical protein